jgi:hypothetical protein
VVLLPSATEHEPVFDFFSESAAESYIACTVGRLGVAGLADAILTLLRFLQRLVDTDPGCLDVIIAQDKQLARTKPADEKDSQHDVFPWGRDGEQVCNFIQHVEPPAWLFLQKLCRKVQLSSSPCLK